MTSGGMCVMATFYVYLISFVHFAVVASSHITESFEEILVLSKLGVADSISAAFLCSNA